MLRSIEASHCDRNNSRASDRYAIDISDGGGGDDGDGTDDDANENWVIA